MKMLSSFTVAGLQALITAQEALGLGRVPGSLIKTFDPIQGFGFSCIMDPDRPALATTLTQYTTLALAQAAADASTCSDIELVDGEVGAVGDVYILATNPTIDPIGRIIEATLLQGSALNLTTATGANITNLGFTLTPGRWALTGSGLFILGGTTTTTIGVGFSTASATLPATALQGRYDLGTTTATGLLTQPFPSVSSTVLTGTLPIFSVAQATFSAGTLGVCGTVYAERIQ